MCLAARLFVPEVGNLQLMHGLKYLKRCVNVVYHEELKLALEVKELLLNKTQFLCCSTAISGLNSLMHQRAGWVHAVAQWLRHCATNRKVAGSILDGAIGIFH
jgi:hypothetical protein